MITKFKLYEIVNEGEPQVGDYIVLCDVFNDKLTEFGNNHIATITHRGRREHQHTDEFILRYENVPAYVMKILNRNESPSGRFQASDYFETPLLRLSTLLKNGYWSNSKEELEDYLMAKKYNL